MESIRSEREFVDLATLFKRVNNIVHAQLGTGGGARAHGEGRALLKEPSEIALRSALDRTGPAITRDASAGKYLDALRAASTLAPLVDQFFTDVLVMVEDPDLRKARLALLGELRDIIWDIADIPALVQEQAV